MNLRRWTFTILTAASTGSATAVRQPAPIVLESFDDLRGWATAPSDGVRLTLERDSGVTSDALRMNIDYQGHAGYAIARHAFTLPPLPSYWSITLRVRGQIPPNTLELKLVDSSGLNVWWMRKLDLHVTPQWTELRFRPRDLSFAWGPLGGGPPRNITHLEIAFTAGSGGRGWLSLDDLILTPLAPPVANAVRPAIAASSGDGTTRLLASAFYTSLTRGDIRRSVAWRSARVGPASLTFNFHGVRDLSGIFLDWADDAQSSHASDFDILASDDGIRWTPLRHVRNAAGGRRFVYLPNVETSWLNLDLLKSATAQQFGLREIRILDDSAAPTVTAFLERVAEASPKGIWPRSLNGEQQYWTVFGLPRDDRDGLMSEDGAVDTHPGGFSLEPFIAFGDTLVSWADGAIEHALDGGTRPMPMVTRTARGMALQIEAFASGAPGASIMWTRYRLLNRTMARRRASLVVSARPVQVNPPWQFLGVPGGAATISKLSWDGAALTVNDTDMVLVSAMPSSIALTPFDGGLSTATLSNVHVSSPRQIEDPTGLASAAMSWSFSLAPGDSGVIWLVQPRGARETVNGSGASLLVDVRRQWDAELSSFHIELPGTGAALGATLRTALGDILVNARGPAIQPGTRSYRRSWIRDGSLTSSALLRLGHASDVHAFLSWFTPYVFADGKVPCCVDTRGADPVAENDSDGELLYLAAEYWRMTGDTAAVRTLWPTLAKTAAHLDSLRNTRRAAMYRAPDSLLVFGLLPPSISHEGYSAKPAYSFWDDFWGVRGLADAALLARLAGDRTLENRYDAASREFRAEVVAAVAQSMRAHHMTVIPGASELGDVDPTSTTIALEPAQLLGVLPAAAVKATFDLAWQSFVKRRASNTWDAYTPYEWRLVGSLVRIGQPERALAMAEWFMGARRPREWNQWGEVVWRNMRAPKFIGDMPHGWVASDFIRSTLDLIEYEREGDSTLVVGAGIPYEWAHDASGIRASGLHTWWGTLDFRAERSARGVKLTVDGVHPPGGIELHAPFGRSPKAAIVNGATTTLRHGTLSVRAPAVVEFVY